MKQINRVALLGAGVMGSAIAAALANAGLDVLLLDRVPPELTDDEKQRGLTAASPEVRNRLASQGLARALKGKPAAFHLAEYARRVAVGNFEDDMPRIAECDWVVEVVAENFAIKKSLFNQVVPHLAEGTIVSTNTSGLSVNGLSELLPEPVRRRFLLTHFFNPPRYMRLLELAPCRHTDPEVLQFMAGFIERRIGKGIVHAKDTPNFVANRIGVYSMFNAINHMVDMGLSVEEVDRIAGPAMARPKSAIFRTADLVGIDTLMHVGNNSYELLPQDEEREIFRMPPFIEKMVAAGLLGSKSGGGFYRKEKGKDGSKILYYDYLKGGYRPLQKPRFDSLKQARKEQDAGARLKALVCGDDRAAEFAWKTVRDTLIYTVNRIPEIADDVLNIDNAMKWGFNWELGPFEMLDAVGVGYFVARAEKDGAPVPESLRKAEAFYSYEGAVRSCWDLPSAAFVPAPLDPGQVDLQVIRKTSGVVEENADSALLDLGDGVFCFEFRSRMNSIGADILAMTHRAIERAEQDGVGLVIGNQGPTFSAGANLLLVLETIAAGRFDEIERMVRAFQQATMAVRHARIPVVAAPFNMALGGGCEFVLHADAVTAHADTYMGLVEVGVGLLPAGGGCKEMTVRALRLAEQYGTDVSPYLFKAFKQIGLASVSTSAAELFDMGYLRHGDGITMNLGSLLADAKQKVIALARSYRPQRPAQNLKAPGRSVAATMKSQLWNMQMGGYATEYDVVIAGLVADVLTGGNVPEGTLVSEHYLLELECESFLRLCGHPQTADRIEHMLRKGKPLRN